MAIEAEDKDSGANGEVRYHLRMGEDNSQDTPEFHLDPITGVLTTKLILDREQQHKYEVRKSNGKVNFLDTLLVWVWFEMVSHACVTIFVGIQ